MTRQRHKCYGATLLAFIGILAVVSILSIGLFTNILSSYVSTVRLERNIQALNLAEAGLEYALYRLNFENAEISPIPVEQKLGSGKFEFTLKRSSDGKIVVTSVGSVPADKPWLTRTVRAELAEINGKLVVSKKAVF